MDRNYTIDYLELPASDLEAVRAFYEKTFGWTFKSFGDDYVSFRYDGGRGGFQRSRERSTVAVGAVLPVIYARDLEGTREAIVANGGRISREVFSFPGGRRFHFTDPHGNELAVWSDR